MCDLKDMIDWGFCYQSMDNMGSQKYEILESQKAKFFDAELTLEKRRGRQWITSIARQQCRRIKCYICKDATKKKQAGQAHIAFSILSFAKKVNTYFGTPFVSSTFCFNLTQWSRQVGLLFQLDTMKLASGDIMGHRVKIENVALREGGVEACLLY